MITQKQALLLPIEIDKANDTLVVTFTDSTSITIDFDKNVYANIFHLLRRIQTEISSGTAILNSDNKIVLNFTKTVNGFTGFNISNILGFLSISNGNLEALYTPENSWFPEYRSNDGEWFKIKSKDIFKGTIGIDGTLSGISYSVSKNRNLEFPFVSVTNCFENTGTAAQSARCFEHIINKSRSVNLKYSTSNNIYIKGLYYIDDITNYQNVTAITQTWDSGTPNKTSYLFCSADAPAPGGQANKTIDTFYDVSVNLTSANAPSW